MKKRKLIEYVAYYGTALVIVVLFYEVAILFPSVAIALCVFALAVCTVQIGNYVERRVVARPAEKPATESEARHG